MKKISGSTYKQLLSGPFINLKDLIDFLITESGFLETNPGPTSVLDIACGHKNGVFTTTKVYQTIPNYVGIDGFRPYLEERQLFDKDLILINHDIREAKQLFLPKSFDLVVALDIIEHLTKEEGLQLLDDLDKITRGLLIVWTTLDYMEQDIIDDNPYQIHKSGWQPNEFIERGYECIVLKNFHKNNLLIKGPNYGALFTFKQFLNNNNKGESNGNGNRNEN